MNIAKIIEKYPKGLKLYSPIFGEVIFEGINPDGWIVCTTAATEMTELFYPEGNYSKHGEIMLFPSKTNRNWETFPKPFVDGDIVTCECGAAKQIFIFKEYATNGTAICYCFLDVDDTLSTDSNVYYVTQHATQQEKERFFIALNKHGYRWNPDTKTLSKLPKFKKGDTITNNKFTIKITHVDNKHYYSFGNKVTHSLSIESQDEWELVIKPIFKVGDKIKDTRNNSEGVILKITDDGYECHFEFGNFLVSFKDQDNWKLMPNKFNVNTLVPFKSEVLVRGADEGLWKPAIYGFSHSNGHYVVGGACWKQCIPYKGNEYLCGTTDDCKDFYKTWKE